MTITEAKGTGSRIETIKALIAKAKGASTDHERDAYFSKAAELAAKYGIDEAMLTETSQRADEVVDRVIWTDRPFSKQMAKLLWNIAQPKGAQARSVTQHTGNTGVGQLKWRHGLRVFAHAADLQMIELMYATARDLALAGASKIRGYEQFGQDQKAHRESYIEGFADGVYQQVRAAQREAEIAAEADRQAAEEAALLRGEITSGRSVALVLADRKALVKNAHDLAVFGKSSAELAEDRARNEARWAESSRRAQEAAAKHRAEQAECKRCQAAKSGYCREHSWMKPSMAQGRSYERVGAYYSAGVRDGREANLQGQGRIADNNRRAVGR